MSNVQSFDACWHGRDKRGCPICKDRDARLARLVKDRRRVDGKLIKAVISAAVVAFLMGMFLGESMGRKVAALDVPPCVLENK